MPPIHQPVFRFASFCMTLLMLHALPVQAQPTALSEVAGIHAIVADPYGSLWLGTADGLQRYHVATDQWGTTLDRVCGGAVTALAHDASGLWIGTTKGLAHMPFSTGDVACLSATTAPIHALTVGEDGTVWLATASRLLQYHPALARAGPVQAAAVVASPYGWMGLVALLLVMGSMGIYQFHLGWQVRRAATLERLVTARTKALQLAHRWCHPREASATPVAPVPTPSFTEALQACVATRFAEPSFDVVALAEAMHLSRRQLERRLASEAGTTPAQVIRQARLHHAAHLLTTTDTPVTSVALDVGFRSAAHFATVFRKHYGMPPSKYAKLHAA